MKTEIYKTEISLSYIGKVLKSDEFHSSFLNGNKDIKCVGHCFDSIGNKLYCIAKGYEDVSYFRGYEVDGVRFSCKMLASKFSIN
jgi:hypothetical protein